VFEHTAAMNNCTITYNPPTRLIVGPTINDDDAVAKGRAAFEKALPQGALVYADKWYGSESFSEYANRFKSAFAFLGVRSPETGGAAHHNEQFDLDENALPYGVAATAAYALEMTESDLDLSGRTWQGDFLDLVDQIGSSGQWASLLREQRAKQAE
jgi:metal-dependent amidase/aminoacylase/carboxypeptidase family protein